MFDAHGHHVEKYQDENGYLKPESNSGIMFALGSEWGQIYLKSVTFLIVICRRREHGLRSQASG